MIRGGGIRAFLRDPRGAVAIEFAAIALPLMLMLIGTIEISRYTWTRLALQDAASTGARCLGLRLAPCFVDDAMDQQATIIFVNNQAAQWGIGLDSDTVTPEASSDCHSVAVFARIGIRHRFTSVFLVLSDTWIEVDACFPAPSS